MRLRTIFVKRRVSHSMWPALMGFAGAYFVVGAGLANDACVGCGRACTARPL